MTVQQTKRETSAFMTDLLLLVVRHTGGITDHQAYLEFQAQVCKLWKVYRREEERRKTEKRKEN